MSDDREFLRESFWAYFNVADETYGDDGLTLEDLDRKMVEKARYVSLSERNLDPKIRAREACAKTSAGH